MTGRRLLEAALDEMQSNPEQIAAVKEKRHCVVIAGPGSGKTKTLTTAMARAILEDVVEPRGIVCITYNNECALELEERLARLGVSGSERIFVGTVHSFALTQVVYPYARCVLPELHAEFRVATASERNDAVREAYYVAINEGEEPASRWKYAELKRRQVVDRTRPEWKGHNPELAMFIEAYEQSLRGHGLVDYDDMALLAVRMLREHKWIRDGLNAKYPVVFVDEYQDLGYALHELVQNLCFDGSARLFAVGDPDQSIYGFTGANPQLLEGLSNRQDVQTVRLKVNYRSGKGILRASIAALGEQRDYVAGVNAQASSIKYHAVVGGMVEQANYIIETLLPGMQDAGIPLAEIAVLYKSASEGNVIAEAATAGAIPYVRADNQALVRRSSRLGRFIESCARWCASGWMRSEPKFMRLVQEAAWIVHGRGATREERYQAEEKLIAFLRGRRDDVGSVHQWLLEFRAAVLDEWRGMARAGLENWDDVERMIKATDPSQAGDMSLAQFCGQAGDTGRLRTCLAKKCLLKSSVFCIEGKPWDTRAT